MGWQDDPIVESAKGWESDPVVEPFEGTTAEQTAAILEAEASGKPFQFSIEGGKMRRRSPLDRFDIPGPTKQAPVVGLSDLAQDEGGAAFGVFPQLERAQAEPADAGGAMPAHRFDPENDAADALGLASAGRRARANDQAGPLRPGPTIEAAERLAAQRAQDNEPRARALQAGVEQDMAAAIERGDNPNAMAVNQLASGIGQQHQAIAGQMGALSGRQLAVMDKIDSGQPVAETDDPMGYLHMNPEQRRAARERIMEAVAASARNVAQAGKAMATIPREADADKMAKEIDSGDWKGAWQTFINNPLAITQQFSLESMPMSAPGMVAGLAGAVAGKIPGFMLGVAAGNYPMEYVAAFSDALQEFGVDVNNPQQVEEALKHPTVLKRIGDLGHRRGMTIAAVEAATARLIQPLARGAGAVKNAGKAALNVGIEAVNEPLGEFAAQVASGQEVKPSEIVAEFLGAGPQAVGSTVARTAAEARDLRSPERIVADALNGTRFDVGLADVVADPAARKIALDKWREEGFARQKAAMGEPAQSPEARGEQPVAESQAPATSEPGDAGVAPGQAAAVPDGLSSALPIDESKALGKMAEQANADGMAMKRADDGDLAAKRAALEEEEKAARVVVEVDSEKTAIRSAARMTRETGEPHQADQIDGKWVVTKEAPSTPPAAEADKKADITPEPPKKRRPAPTFASSTKYDVDTEDDGAFEATVHRTKDGGAVIVDARGGFSEYNKDFASGKSDEDLLRYDIVGFKGAARRQAPAVPRVSDPTAPTQEELHGETVDAANAKAQSPGDPLPNGFRVGPQQGEKFRVGRVAAMDGGVQLEKRLPAGTVASFFVKKDGTLFEPSVNRAEDRSAIWVPETAERGQQAESILNEMGALALTDPRRADAKARLKALVTAASTVDSAAHEAATSPKNDLPEPTQAMKEAGNYKKGHVTVSGIDISIENPVGSTRSGVDANGRKWSNTMRTNYGYAKGTVGLDKDHLDFVIPEGTPQDFAGTVYVVNQNHANGRMDEHKIVLGAASEEEAKRLYLSNYTKGWESRIRSIVPMTMPEFKAWAYDKTERGPKGGEVKAKEIANATPVDVPAPAAAAEGAGATATAPAPVDERVSRPAESAVPAAEEAGAPAGAVTGKDGKPRVWKTEKQAALWLKNNPQDGRTVQPTEGGYMVAPEPAATGGFDLEAWDRARADRIKASKADGNTHLDVVPAYVETMRGKEFYNVHDPKERGVVRTVANTGEVVVHWADEYSAKKNLVDAKETTNNRGKKVTAYESWLMPSDLKDYVFAKPAVTAKAPAQTEAQPTAKEQAAPKPAEAVKKPRVSKPDPMAVIRDHYTPGNIVFVDYWKQHDRVLAFREETKDRSWSVQVEKVEKQPDGSWKAVGAPRWHSTAPGRDTVTERAPAAAQFANNKVFTADKVAAARKRLKAKLGTLNSGIDPELLVDGMTIAGAYIESGVRTFKDYSEAMIADLGDAVKPYLLSFYEAVRAYPGIEKGGMSTPDEASSAHAALIAAAPGVVEQAIVGETPKVKKSKKPVRVSDGGMKLTQDWGGEINGYDSGDERPSGPLKRQFLAEAKKYLELVAEKLREAGFSPHLDRKGRPDRPVSVNEGGVAGSGDVSLTMRKGDAGVYVTIGASSLRGVVPTNKQGVTIMARTTPDAANDRYATKGSNQWLESTLTAADLAAWAEKRVSLIQPVVDIPKAEQNTKQEDDHGQPLQTDNVPDATPRADSGRGGRRGGRGKQVAPGVAGQGESPDRQGGLFDGPQGAGDAGTGAVREPERADASGPARDRAGVRADDGAPGDVGNFEITDATGVGEGGLKKKYRDNIAAIKILKELDEQKRVATPDEREAIARYVGWGGLKAVFDPNSKGWASEHAELKALLTEAEWVAARKSILNAHYTSPAVVGAMWDAIGRLGFTSGRVLEPSVGVGNFFGLMPKAMRGGAKLFGVELDHLTSRIAAALYPRAQIAKATGFQDYKIPSGYFDLAVGNPPFGSEPIVDDDRSPYSGFSIHNYFFAKSIDKLREGGLLVMVVSHSFLDRMSPAARNWIAQRAELVSAVRLPRTAFKENAGTEVVTDILVLRRVAERPVPKEDWLSTSTLTLETEKGESAKAEVNDYFLANPRNVLGRQTAAGSMYRANEYTVEPTGDLSEQLAEWVKGLPEGVYVPMERGAEQEAADVVLPDGVKIGTFYIDENGAVMQRAPDALGKQQAVAWVAPSDMAEKRMRAMIPLREALRGQMRLEKDPLATEAAVESGRKDLNKLYDAFVREFGFVNSQVNRRVFLDDPEAPLLQALEVDYDKGLGKTSKAVKEDGAEPRPPFAKKADILKRRVLFPPNENLHISSAKDALIASLNYKGRMDVPYMEGLYGKSGEEIIAELGDVVYVDPQDGPVTADEYLSGDVKTKLEEAKAAAESDGKFARNVSALEKVIPADLMPSQIFASPGAAWIDRKDYEAFLKEITGHESVAIHYIAATASWAVHAEGTPDAGKESAEYGTSRIGATKLFTELLNGKAPIIYDRMPDDTRVVNKEATEAANERQNKIREKWNSWIWADAERSTRLAKVYNERHNRTVERQFDGSHMTFPGMTPAIQLRKSQKDSAWRGLQDRQVLMDHVVGAGKTFAGAALAMEFRRLAVARKPLFIVPNHLTLSWRQEFYRLYPTANVLVALPDDFSKDNRRRLFSKIATGDWDSVIIGHSSLKKIGLPAATEEAIVGEQLAEIAAGIEELKRERGDRNLIRDMEKIKATLEAKMKKRQQQVGTRDDVVSFDELGVDAVFLDEFHEFKNLFFTTQKQRVAGMGNPEGSAKAFDLFVKIRWLFETFGQKAPLVTMTGTPVSNSLAEMFTVQRYMQYAQLKRDGLHLFDAWAKMFGDDQNVYEVSPSGVGYRVSQRFARFKNLPALMGMYRGFADVITMDDLKQQAIDEGKVFPVPKIGGGRPQIIVAKKSPLQNQYIGEPELARTPDGDIEFEAPVEKAPEIEQGKDGRWMVRTDRWSASFATEEEAREGYATKALTPVIGFNKPSLLDQFANLRDLTRQTKGRINALSLTNLANKVALDYRLIEPGAADFAGSKVNESIKHMLRIYKKWGADKGTQLVFCDLSVPLSARKRLGAKEARVYIRDDQGALTHARGTVNSVEGFESFPFYLIPRGKGATKTIDMYDPVSGARIRAGLSTREEARTWAAEFLGKEENREKWLDYRDSKPAISEEELEDYKNANDFDEESGNEITGADLEGVASATAFSIYDDIKAKLVAQGVPEREIAFIHDFDTPKAKMELFKRVNRGEVRFLLGSTPKLGAGTNVQERVVALHHIDAPWRPSDLEQREGRVVRQGNKLYERDPDGFEVEILRYATEQTYDTRRWQILEHKAAGIEQLRKYGGELETEDVSSEAANAAEMKAAASGSPLILKETELRTEVRRLEALRNAHQDEQYVIKNRISYLLESVARAPKRIAKVERALATIAKHPETKGEFTPITVDGRKITERNDAIAVLTSFVNKVIAGEAREVPIEFRGLNLTLHRVSGSLYVSHDDLDNVVASYSPDYRTKQFDFSPAGLLTRLENYTRDRLPASLEQSRGYVVKDEKEIAELTPRLGKAFEEQGRLDAAKAEHADVQRRLMKENIATAIRPKDREAVNAAIAARREALAKMGFGDALEDLDRDAPRLSRPASELPRSTSGQGLTRGAVQDIATALGSDAEVLASAKSLPAHLYTFLKRSGSDTIARGLYDPDSGRVFVFADKIGSPELAAFVILHESVHRGLRRTFGGELDPILREIYDSNATVKTRANLRRAKYKESIERATEEVIADMALRGVARNLSGWQRFVAFVREWLAERGFRVAWTDAMVEYLAGAAAEAGKASAPAVFTDADARMLNVAPPLWYSELAVRIAGAKQETMPGPQWKAWLTNQQGLKADEIEWSGIKDWLGTQGAKVTKQQVLDYLHAGGVKVEETTLGEGPRAALDAVRDKYVPLLEAAGASAQEAVRLYEAIETWATESGARDEEAPSQVVADKDRAYEMLRPAIRRGDIDGNEIHDAAWEVKDGVSETKFASYQLPGGQNYRELLLTLPEKGDGYRVVEHPSAKGKWAIQEPDGRYIVNDRDTVRPGMIREWDREDDAKQFGLPAHDRKTFRSSHFQVPNILAHVRFNERTDADGKRILFIEEIQSDWAQKGKKEGFLAPGERERLTREHDAAMKRTGESWPDALTALERVTEKPLAAANGLAEMASRDQDWQRTLGALTAGNTLAPSERAAISDWITAYATEQRTERALTGVNRSLPAAPFVGKTEAWVGLALKRMIRYAADHGFDGIAWTNGEQQAARYDLSKQIQEVYVTTHSDEGMRLFAFDHSGRTIITGQQVTDSTLQDYIGKDAAEKLLNLKPEWRNARETRRLSGLDLKVGGEGMAAFYDKIVPNVANDVLKKLGGGRVGALQVGIGVVDHTADEYGFDTSEIQFKRDPSGNWTIERGAAFTVAGEGRYWDGSQWNVDESMARVFRSKADAMAAVTAKTQPGFYLTEAMKAKAEGGMPLFSRPLLSRATDDDLTIAGRHAQLRGAGGKITERLNDLFHSNKTFNRLHKSIGTQYQKAHVDPHFRRVFRKGQEYLAEFSRAALDAADMAPTLLPKLEGFRDIPGSIFAGASKKDTQAAGKAILEGTLQAEGGDPFSGKVFADGELKKMGLTERQIGLYREARAAIDASLDLLHASEVANMARTPEAVFGAALTKPKTPLARLPMVLERAKKDPGHAGEIVGDYLAEVAGAIQKKIDGMTFAGGTGSKLAADLKAEKRRLLDLATTLVDKQDQIGRLKAAGYAPLQRYGKYSVSVYSDGLNEKTGEPDLLYFSLHESEREANAVKRQLEQDPAFADAVVEAGIKSENGFQLYRGLTPDTLELFATTLGLGEDSVFQTYLKVAKNSRSAFKRMIHRKGTEGFQTDLTRSLASFITSNARAVAGNWHMGELVQAADAIPKHKGDVKDEAVKLVRYLQEPQEEAAFFRSLLFMNYLGGSLAAGLVNMTQPLTMTLPYLGQWGNVEASKELSRALKDALKAPDKLERALEEAMARGIEEGVVAPHEVHMLHAEAMRNMGSNLAWRKVMTAWGSVFAATEAFNRRTTFIAAYRTAKRVGASDPYRFAVQAVEETQGIYNRGNKPNWARGAVGASIFCVDDSTDALTQRGWLGPDELRPGDMMASFDMDTGRLRWMPLQEVHTAEFDGEMVHATSRSLDMLMTPDHRVVHYKNKRVKGGKRGDTEWSLGIAEAQDIPASPRVQIPTAAEFDHVPQGTPIRGELAPVLGWVVTEGYIPKQGYVCIYQNEGEKAEKIRSDLQAAGFTWTESRWQYDGGSGEHVRFFIKASQAAELRDLLPCKQLTPALLMRMTREQIAVMVERMIDGDGSTNATGSRCLLQNPGETLEAFQMALTILGKSYSVRRHGPACMAVLIREPQDSRAVGRYSVRRSVRVPYNGRVWCPIIPDTCTWVARRNGMPFITHNTFKQFSVSYIEMLVRLPTQQRLVALAVMFLLAGMQGLPFAEDLEDIIDTVAQRFGYSWNTKQEARRVLAKFLARTGSNFIARHGADVVMHGISHLPGVPLDVQGRLGMGNLIPGSSIGKLTADPGREAFDALGAAGAFGKGVATAGGLALEGNFYGAGRAVLPVAVENIRRAVEMWQTGMYKDARGNKVMNVTKGDAAVKLIGFQPQRVAKDTKKVGEQMQNINLHRAVEDRIADKMAAARFEKETARTTGQERDAAAKLADANRELTRWNMRNPTAKITIEPSQITTRVNTMKAARSERITKRAPKEIRDTVREALE